MLYGDMARLCALRLLERGGADSVGFWLEFLNDVGVYDEYGSYTA